MADKLRCTNEMTNKQRFIQYLSDLSPHSDLELLSAGFCNLELLATAITYKKIYIDGIPYMICEDYCDGVVWYQFFPVEAECQGIQIEL